MGESKRFDLDALMELIRQKLTNKEYRNFQNLDEEFDEAQELIEEDFEKDPDILREILRQGMTIEEYRNFEDLYEEYEKAKEPIEEDFDYRAFGYCGPSFVNKGAGGEDG